jgi:lysophospholipase L1-like esterase
MKLGLLATLSTLLIAVAAPAAAAEPPGASGGVAPLYYVSLGDSLAAGTQPNEFSSSEGYADQLAADLQVDTPNLQLVKLGCPGESTTTMIDGGLPYEGRSALNPCQYPQGTQLATAVAFLHAHRQFVRLVTIDLGPNDVFAGGGVPAIVANLPVILTTLRAAAGPGVPIVGMNFYDPFLVVWFTNPAALPAEIASIVGFNNVLEGLYAAAGDPVADVETAFSTTNTTLVGGIPLDVLRICQWTWMCTAFQNIHANATGYGVIAHAFEAVLP